MANLEQLLIEHQVLVTFLTSTIASLVTLAAVVVAWRTAASTRRTVEEMRETRLQAVRPVLYLTARARSLGMEYKRDGLFPGLKYGTTQEPVSTLFEIRNTVGAPAFDISCEWQLCENATLPPGFKLATVQHIAADKKWVTKYEEGKVSITEPNADPDDFFSFFDVQYSRMQKTDHFEILGREKKSVSLPSHLANQLALLALFHAEQRQLYKESNEIPDIKLIATVACTSPNGEVVRRKFGFEISFWMMSGFYREDQRVERGQVPADWTRIEVVGSISPIPQDQMPPIVVTKPASDSAASMIRIALRSFAKAAPGLSLFR